MAGLVMPLGLELAVMAAAVLAEELVELLEAQVIQELLAQAVAVVGLLTALIILAELEQLGQYIPQRQGVQQGQVAVVVALHLHLGQLLLL